MTGAQTRSAQLAAAAGSQSARDVLRLELARAARAGRDDEVQAILEQLGPIAVDELDALDDRGIAAGNWGVER